MKAIVKNAGAVSLGIIENPTVERDDDVVVRVRSAGLCRTDVYVADGVIRTRDPLVLGHEFSGVVEAVGASVSRAKAGDRVAVFPVIACGACRECRSGRANLCQRTLGDIAGTQPCIARNRPATSVRALLCQPACPA